MKTFSVWQSTKLTRFPPLRSGEHFDVVVVGGGMTGLSAAYLLKQAGKKVCLLERDRLGGVDSSFTTAHLTAVTDIRLPEIVKGFGKQAAQRVWDAGAEAIRTIEQISQRHGIACDFRRVPGFLHASLVNGKDETKKLKQEAELARELGIEATFLPSVPGIGKPGVRFSNQAKFHPRKYMAALAGLIHGDGSQICEMSEVEEVQDDPLTVVARGIKLKCDHLVLATHVPLMGKASLIGATLFQSKIAAFSSYVLGAKIPRGILPEALYWDTTDPYYYLRVDSRDRDDYVIFGGEDHKTGQVDDVESCYAKLEEQLRAILPMAKVERRWSGQVIESHDGLPYIGEMTKRQFASTAYAGNGMTFGTIGGMMASDYVLERENPWQELFAPGRKKMRGAWSFVRENMDYPYYWLKDRLARPEDSSTRSIGRGDGKVLMIDGQRVACSRDDRGKLTQVSAVCTHMGCIVHWNGAEKTWDCPCHGARYQPTGEVLSGPAEEPLEPIDAKKAEAKKTKAR